MAATRPPSALDERDNQPLKPADGATAFAESSVPSTTKIENGGHACYWIQDVFREVFFVSEAQRKSQTAGPLGSNPRVTARNGVVYRFCASRSVLPGTEYAVTNFPKGTLESAGA